jgi:hypothetical protein
MPVSSAPSRSVRAAPAFARGYGEPGKRMVMVSVVVSPWAVMSEVTSDSPELSCQRMNAKNRVDHIHAS